jgi:hypothetical protein
MGIFTKKPKPVPLLPTDYITSVCEIKTMENELISTGTIAEISAEFIKIGKKVDPLVRVKTGKRVKINVFNTKKGFRVMLGTVYTSAQDFMKIVEIVELADHDRRQFFRVNLELTAYVYEKGDLETAKKLPINIRDMSLSGLRIEMDPPPEIGDVIWIELNLSGRAYCCQCRVMRRIPVGKAIKENFGKELIEEAKTAIEEGKTDFEDKSPETTAEKPKLDEIDRKNPTLNDNTKNDTEKYQYGCAFLFNEHDDTDPLCSFLFKKQGEEIRRIRAEEQKKEYR